jgi:hypothetical protein
MQDRNNTLNDLIRALALAIVAGLLAVPAAQAATEEKPVYRCPGNLYTDALSAKEAIAKGCKTLEGAPITVIQSIKSTVKAAAPTPGGEKVGADDQKARDSDKRRILEAELKKAEDELAALQKQYNNGQPERQGDERNFQKYQDRVNDLKASVTRKQADVDALKRELASAGTSK